MSQNSSLVSQVFTVLSNYPYPEEPFSESLPIPLSQKNHVEDYKCGGNEVSEDQNNARQARCSPAAFEVDRDKHGDCRDQKGKNVIE